jgi:hypothetical protein
MQILYNQNNYSANHVWNSNKTSIHVGRQLGAQDFARRGLNHIYNIIPKFQQWLIVNYVMNVTNGIMLGFYIFKGEKLENDYIKFSKTNTCMAHNTKKTWMTYFMFKVFFFK